MEWLKLYRVTLRQWDHGLKSDFFFTLGEGVVEVLQSLESDLGQDLEEVKSVDEVDEMLIFLPPRN